MGCEESCASPQQAARPAAENGGERRTHRRKKQKNRQEVPGRRDSQTESSAPKRKGRKRAKEQGQTNDNGAATTSGSDQSADAATQHQTRAVASNVEQAASPALPTQSEAPLPIPPRRAAPSKFNAHSTSDPPGGRAAPAPLPPNPLLPRIPSTMDSDHSLASSRSPHLTQDSGHRQIRSGAGSPRANALRAGASGPSVAPNLSSAKRQRIHRWIDSGFYAELLDPQDSAAQKRLEERFARERQAANSSTSSASRTTSSISGHRTAPASNFAVVKATTQSDLSVSSNRRNVAREAEETLALLTSAEAPSSEKEVSSNSTIVPKSPTSDPLSTQRYNPSA